MSEGLLELRAVQQEVPLAEQELRSRRAAIHNRTVLDDFAHELRQPLSVIETLAYYLEITSPDEKVCEHLQRIREMVSRANSILERNFTPT